MIGVINYGLGNIEAFANIYRRLKIDIRIIHNPGDFDGVSKLILPGVGAFDWAMTRLANSGLGGPLEELVVEERKPILGVCVGMQMMGNRSEEGIQSGLGWIRGSVHRFTRSGTSKRLHLPNMGWNDVSPKSRSALFAGLESNARFYFLHSYYFKVQDSDDVAAEADYGRNFTAAISYENIHGVQFHPEKSHDWGIRLLENFASL